MSVNAAKWAGVAKDSVFKLSKTAADKATEISSKVTEQAKDGSLLTNVQSGVTNIASTMGKLGTKTWSDMQSLWAGKDYHSVHREDSRLQNNYDDFEQQHSWSSSSYQHQTLGSGSGSGSGSGTASASGYQTNTSNSLPTKPAQTNSDLSGSGRDLSFESWLNDEPKAKTSTTKKTTSTSTKTKVTPVSAPTPTPAPTSAPAAPNLITFDDDKWADDDDAGWESIETK